MGSIRNRGTKESPKWYIRYTEADGTPASKLSHQPTATLARKMLVEVEARIARGKLGMPDEREQGQKSISVADMFRRYADEINDPELHNLAMTRRRARGILSHHIEPDPIAKMPAGSVRKHDVEDFRNRLYALGTMADGTVFNIVVRLSAAYHWALEREIIVGRNPVSGVFLRPPATSEDFFALDEARRLVKTSPMMAFALYQGWRKGEILGLTWPRVDLDKGTVQCAVSYRKKPKTKATVRTAPLHPELIPILREWRDRCPQTDEGIVFPVEVEQPRMLSVNAMRRARGLPELASDRPRYRMGRTEDLCDVSLCLTRAGIPKRFPGRRGKLGWPARPWYATRHTLITLLREARVHEGAVKRIVGHSAYEEGATAVYSHLSLDYLRDELARVSFKSDEVVPSMYRSSEIASRLGIGLQSFIDAYTANKLLRGMGIEIDGVLHWPWPLVISGPCPKCAVARSGGCRYCGGAGHLAPTSVLDLHKITPPVAPDIDLPALQEAPADALITLRELAALSGQLERTVRTWACRKPELRRLLQGKPGHRQKDGYRVPKGPALAVVGHRLAKSVTRSA